MSGSDELNVVLLLWQRHVVTALGKPSGSVLSLTIPGHMEVSFCVSGRESVPGVISKYVIAAYYTSIFPWLGRRDLELYGDRMSK